MDEIARRLRSEILSLEEYIQRAEERFLAAEWAGELIDPFERLESRLDGEDLQATVAALHRARTRFQVNGHIAERIDAILQRHAGIVAALTESSAADGPSYDDVVLPPDDDPGDATTDAAGLREEGDDESPEPPEPRPADDDEGGPEATDELFDEADTARRPPRSRRDAQGRDATTMGPAIEDGTSSLFAHALSLGDVEAGLDLVIPPDDRIALERRLRERLEDPVIAALRASEVAQGQYVLLPRVSRFLDASGNPAPCTVKNLARRYSGLFGDIRDLVPHRSEGIITTEMPESGWALITPESPRESLDRNYPEQAQYIRYLSTSLGIPSRMLRRRTLVEALYDLVVGQLVLGLRFQSATFDWTSSSTARNDYACIYYPLEGLRVRGLSRMTRHRSVGVTPTW